MPFLSYLREKFPWFPTIDSDACRADLQCLNFCPHDVFEWDPKTGRPFVAHPLRCLPGCEICLEGCTRRHFLADQTRVSSHVEKAARGGKQASQLASFFVNGYIGCDY